MSGSAPRPQKQTARWDSPPRACQTRLRESSLLSLCLCFLVCKVKWIRAPTSLGRHDDESSYYEQNTWQLHEPGTQRPPFLSSFCSASASRWGTSFRGYTREVFLRPPYFPPSLPSPPSPPPRVTAVLALPISPLSLLPSSLPRYLSKIVISLPADKHPDGCIIRLFYF